MTPFEAYQDTATRAWQFVRLYEGLINIIRHRIRRNWKEAVCGLMKWPLASQIERVDSADAIVVLKDGATLKPSDFTSDALTDLLRSAIVFGVSALDRYLHERVVHNIIAALKRAPMTKSQEKFSIPITTVIQITESISKARRAGNNVRPANEVRKKVQEILHQRPFQSWKEVEYAFELLGTKNLAGKLQTAMQIGDILPVKKQLNQIVDRRNRIVHEGDIVRHQRGGRIRSREVQPSYVKDSLKFLDNFVTSLEKVV